MQIPYLQRAVRKIANYNELNFEERKVAFDIVLFCYVGLAVFSITAGDAFLNEKFVLGIWLFLFDCGCFGFLAAMRFNGYRASHPFGFIAYLSIGYFYLLVSGGFQNTGLYWCYLFSPLMYTFLGYRNGVIANSLLVAAALIYFHVLPEQWTISHYPEQIESRFAASYFVLSVLLFIQELSRTMSNQRYQLRSQQLIQSAHADPLTKIFNRRGLNSVLKIFEEEETSKDRDTALLLIDVDYFKPVNDDFGHDVGDSILIILANELKNNLRIADTLGRWGGEEFLIILDNIKYDNAVRVAEKLRSSVQQSEEIKKLLQRELTISIGMAQRVVNDSNDDWIKRVDQRLYQAKNSGRNRVVSMD